MGRARSEGRRVQRSRKDHYLGKLTAVLIYLHEFPPEVEARIRVEAKRFKEPLPKKIQEKPELHFGSALFLNAWFDLDTERNRAKFQRINRAMCFDYAEDYDLDEEQKEDLWFHISAMDRDFLDWWIKKQPKARTPRSPTKGKGSGRSRGVRQGDAEES